MKIKFLTGFGGSLVTYNIDSIHDIDKPLAKRLIEKGYAIPAKKSKENDAENINDNSK